MSLQYCRVTLLSGRSAPSAGQQIDIRSRLKQRVGRGLDAIHPRNRIEDKTLLLAGIIRSNRRQTDFAECELRPIFRPTDRGIIYGVSVLSQLHHDAKFNRFFLDSFLEFVEEEVRGFPRCASIVQIFIAGYG
jgi:hypothetical protein